jgi:NAD(P)-dependent dehydrogenase (short-subunit alcohol dehydrogenase family)
MRRMRILVTGGSGVLGRVTVTMLRDIGHHIATPSSSELDLFDAKQVRSPSPIPTPCCTWLPASPLRIAKNLPGAWDVNDRLRAHANISKRDQPPVDSSSGSASG